MILRVANNNWEMVLSYSEWYRTGISEGWISTAQSEYLVTTGTLYEQVNALGHLYDDVADNADGGKFEINRFNRAVAETKRILAELRQSRPVDKSPVELAKFDRMWSRLNALSSTRDISADELASRARAIGDACIELGRAIGRFGQERQTAISGG